MSTESGAGEVYVRAVDKPVKLRVSNNGSANLVWRRDVRELFYEAPSVTIMATKVMPGEALGVSTPKVLFRACSAEGGNLAFPDYDVTHDGKRFLFSCFAQGTNRRTLTVGIAWQQMVKWPAGHSVSR
jgi:hypothetical protein